MCTVTFMPQTNGGFILTSNRDEAPNRETLPPAVYENEGTKLLFPKDALAGGTWVGLSDRDRLICLLNGGFEPHERKNSYRLSRGVIVTSLLVAENAEATIKGFDFSDIEPFTIILLDWKGGLQLFELVWDGKVSHFSEKPLEPCIWSSSLLYTSEVKKQREDWFSDFLFKQLPSSTDALINFHKNAGIGNKATNLVMDRGFVRTKSISQVEKNNDLATFRYEDLQTEIITTLSF